MNFRNLFVVFAVLGAIGLLSAAALAQPWEAVDCTDSSDAFDCAPSVGGSASYSLIASPSTLNPVTANDTASGTIYEHIFGSAGSNPFATLDFGILGSGATGLAPRAASVIEVNEAGTVVTYTLRDGATFADGSPVTADDVLYWYNDVVYNPNLPNSSTAAFVCTDGNPFTIEAQSATQLTVSCNAPFRTYTGLAGAQFVISKQMALDFIDVQGIATEDGVNGPRAVQEFMGLGVDISMLDGGLGPFVIDEFISDQVARFSRNDAFYGVDSNGTQLPYLDNLEVLIFPTNGQNLALSAFLNGQTGWLGTRPEDVSIVISQAGPSFNVNNDIDNGTPAAGTAWITPNFDDPNPNLAAAARNQTIRRAMSLAYDRTAAVFNVLLGLGTPQYTMTTLSGNAGTTFFLGRNNTCDTFINAGLATADNCVGGVWSLDSGLSLQVNRLPDPNSTPEALQHLGCLVDYDACVAEAAALLDSVGVVDTDGDGIRNIPADLDGFGNPGGNFEVSVRTNAGNTTRLAYSEIACSSWAPLDISCSAGEVAFSTLVSELLGGTFSGYIMLGLTGGDPAGGANIYQCGAALYFWHLSCDPNATDGLTAQDPASAAVEAGFDEGFAATTVPDAQVGFDKEQIEWLKGEPFMHLAIPNALFAARTDQVCNHGRSTNGNSHLKFRVDLAGNESACTTN